MNPIKKINRLRKKAEHRETMDMDYIHKLSLEEAEYLAKFCDEHYEGNKEQRDTERVAGRRKRQNDFYALNPVQNNMPEDATTATAEDVLIAFEELEEEK